MHILEHITTMRERSWAWFDARAHGTHAQAWLAITAFLEPTVSPIVPEALLAAILLSKSDRWVRYAVIASAASLAGGVFGYFIFGFLYDIFGTPIVGLYGLQEQMAQAQVLLAGSIFAIMLFATFTPVPDKALVMAAGGLGAPFIPFLFGYLAGRTARFFLVAYLVHRFGATILAVINRYFFYLALLVVLVFVYYISAHFGLLPW